MLFLLILVVMFVVSRGVRMEQKLSKFSSGPCKLHKWEYNSSGFLQCSVCRNFPGYEGRE